MEIQKHTIQNLDPYVSLQKIRYSNINRLIVEQLNIKSLKSKFEGITNLIKHIDILVLTETKLDETFPKNQFLIHGYSPPFHQDRNSNGGGFMIYVREDIPCEMLSKHDTPDDFEGIVLELNPRKVKCFLFGAYNPYKDNISNFVRQLGPIVDTFLSTYDNLLLLWDFNSETSEFIRKELCEMYNLKNLIKDTTCSKNPSNPSSTDVMLTNRPRSFLNSTTTEPGLSDHHKLTISVLKTFFQKQA